MTHSHRQCPAAVCQRCFCSHGSRRQALAGLVDAKTTDAKAIDVLAIALLWLVGCRRRASTILAMKRATTYTMATLLTPSFSVRVYLVAVKTIAKATSAVPFSTGKARGLAD
jgi:hypothetical protein